MLIYVEIGSYAHLQAELLESYDTWTNGACSKPDLFDAVVTLKTRSCENCALRAFGSRSGAPFPDSRSPGRRGAIAPPYKRTFNCNPITNTVSLATSPTKLTQSPVYR